mmetsp:Transcript_21612/g.51337  ORF Transcript_21612/g.51337 Transcript_21612/m.51337 type:complete len:246 (-) Transcript_21612:956-1693(-)
MPGFAVHSGTKPGRLGVSWGFRRGATMSFHAPRDLPVLPRSPSVDERLWRRWRRRRQRHGRWWQHRRRGHRPDPDPVASNQRPRTGRSRRPGRRGRPAQRGRRRRLSGGPRRAGGQSDQGEARHRQRQPQRGRVRGAQGRCRRAAARGRAGHAADLGPAEPGCRGLQHGHHERDDLGLRHALLQPHAGQHALPDDRSVAAVRQRGAPAPGRAAAAPVDAARCVQPRGGPGLDRPWCGRRRHPAER